ncbi:MAG: ribosome recycling factor [Candidatus Omnitrophica bacterium]|nr:ribosome recycling factor [Candidatus Omnitrophota bacterium]
MNLRDLLRETEEKMDKTVEATQRELATVRTGRASTALLEGVKVSYYDTPTPLKQIATITTPDPKLIVVQPWDGSLLGEIERALLGANLGITPTNDGRVIRLSMPQLTTERREELAKIIRKMAEDGRISIRTGRHHAIELVRKLKDKGISEDEVFTTQDEIQKLTDKHINKIDELLKQKEREVLEL